MKKIGKILTGMILCAVMIVGRAVPIAAADGVLELSVSGETVNQGENLTVTVSAKTSDGKEAVSIMRVTYDASVFSFVSCSEICGAGSGLVSVTTNQATITLKATGSGESVIEVTGEDGVAYESAEELSQMTGDKKTVTVKAPSTGSSKTDLSSLAVSTGTLTPAFSPSTKEYATVVPNETTSVAVNAKPADSSAKVQSLSGNTNLAVGDNPVTVTVRSDSGATETYTIHVVRAEEGQSVAEAQSIATAALSGQDGADAASPVQQTAENPEEVTVGSVLYRISDSFPSDFQEPDFVADTLSFQGADFPARRFEKNSDIYLVSLKSEEGTEAVYVYNRITGQFSPFVKLQNGDRYIIVLAPPAAAELPAGYVGLTLDLNGQGDVTAYQKLTDGADGTQKDSVPDVTDEEEFDPSAVGMLFQELFGTTEVYAADRSDFYLMYAVNNDGKEDWYQYDLGEETYQRYSGVTEDLVLAEAPQDAVAPAGDAADLKALKDEFEQFRKLALYILIGIAAGFLLLLILLIVFGVQLSKARKGIGGKPADDEEEEESLWEELEESKEKEEDPEDSDEYLDPYAEEEEAEEIEEYGEAYEDAYEDAYEEPYDELDEEPYDEPETVDLNDEEPEPDEPEDAQELTEEPDGDEETFAEEPDEDEAAFADEPEEEPVEEPKKKKKRRFGRKEKEEEKTLWEELADEDEAAGDGLDNAFDTKAEAVIEEPEQPPAEEEPEDKAPEEKPKKRARKPKKDEEKTENNNSGDSDDDLEVLDLNDL